MTGPPTPWPEDDDRRAACLDAEIRELLDSRSRHEGLVLALREIEAAMRKVAGDTAVRMKEGT